MKNKKKMLLVFSHTLTSLQRKVAKESFYITKLIALPDHLQNLWSNMPVDKETISTYLIPVKQWIKKNASRHDFILIQGDFGATFLIVNYAFKNGLIPVYATTTRNALETTRKNGFVKLEHIFKFCRFRQYELHQDKRRNK